MAAYISITLMQKGRQMCVCVFLCTIVRLHVIAYTRSEIEFSAVVIRKRISYTQNNFKLRLLLYTLFRTRAEPFFIYEEAFLIT